MLDMPLAWRYPQTKCKDKPGLPRVCLLWPVPPSPLLRSAVLEASVHPPRGLPSPLQEAARRGAACSLQLSAHMPRLRRAFPDRPA